MLLCLLFFFLWLPFVSADVACPTPLTITSIKIGDVLIVCEKGRDDYWLPLQAGDMVQVLAIQTPFLVVKKIALSDVPPVPFSIPMQGGIKLMNAGSGYMGALTTPIP